MPRPRKPHWHKRDACYYTTVDGKRVMLRHADGAKVGHGDERGAREALDRELARRDSLIRRGIDPTVEDVCRDYLIACSADNTDETMDGKEWVLSKWCAFGDPPYGGRPARDIDSTHLHRMRKDWERQGHTGNMLRRLFQEVMACWAWASRPEPERTPLVILDRNPLAGMRRPSGSPSRAKYVRIAVPRALIVFAEARASTLGPVLARFERQAILMLRLLAESGCRPKEACSATWEDFDPAKRKIVLDPSRHKTGRKTGKLRTIVVSDAVAADLVALRGSGYAHPTHLFAHKRGRGVGSRGAERDTGAPWQRPGYTAWFLRLLREARAAWEGETDAPVIPEGMTLYWLRHSFLTDAQGGIGAERAADLGGNSKELARGTYLHVQDEQLLRDADEVARRREVD